MILESTRHQSPAVSFRDAILAGLAPDGGLYLPTAWPTITGDELREWRSLPFPALAVRLARRLLAGEFPDEIIDRLVLDALDFPVPAVEVEPGRFVLELFHGPTLAFKDFGARFLARFFSHLLGERGERATILVATSGDTGSAVAQGFFGVPGVSVVVLYPRGKVSPFQESQMATLGGNIVAMRVAGTFDDCQRLVKTAFLDPDLARLHLSSANSINIGRLLPQSFYYVGGYLSVVDQVGEQVSFSVPTGNVGNLTAGVIARLFGTPIANLIAASNVNRVLPDYLESGTYRPRAAIATLSSAMDVGDPSNLSRLLALHRSFHDMRRAIVAFSVDEDETRATIRRVYEEAGYVLDPHTAVAWTAAGRALAAGRVRPPVVTLATAHPAKFGDAIRAELGVAPALPDVFANWRERRLSLVELESPGYPPFKRHLLAATHHRGVTD